MNGNERREEVIQEICEIAALAYHSIGDHTGACDCFCRESVHLRQRKRERELGGDAPGGPWNGFRWDGDALEFVRQAVLEKLQRDGIEVDEYFDPRTGRVKEKGLTH